MKKQKGITLVSLVVTIIVLIILVGISINLILGDNGIITIAKRAKENTELARIEEETELNELYTQLETGGSSSGNLPYDSIAKLTEFKTAIANAIDEAGGVKPDISAETSVFSNNIKEIVKEVTKNATATANDIAKGKTAWVNGKLITGNSSENSIIKPLIPRQTENTDKILYNGVLYDGYNSYWAFNGIQWNRTINYYDELNQYSKGENLYIGYDFSNAVNVKLVEYSYDMPYTPWSDTCYPKVQASNDNNVWTDIGIFDYKTLKQIEPNYLEVNAKEDYRYWRIYVEGTDTQYTRMDAIEIQMWG